MTDRDGPGLVALYDIRPGNGACQFLQPRSPHGAPIQHCLFLKWPNCQLCDHVTKLIYFRNLHKAVK